MSRGKFIIIKLTESLCLPNMSQQLVDSTPPEVSIHNIQFLGILLLAALLVISFIPNFILVIFTIVIKIRLGRHNGVRRIVLWYQGRWRKRYVRGGDIR